MFNMDCNDDRIINVICCPTKGMTTILVFANSHHDEVYMWFMETTERHYSTYDFCHRG